MTLHKLKQIKYSITVDTSRDDIDLQQWLSEQFDMLTADIKTAPGINHATGYTVVIKDVE